MAKKSFWEQLGRGVGHGWKKARQVSSRIGESLEPQGTEEKLSGHYRELGRRAAAELLDAGKEAFVPSGADRELLEEIRKERLETEAERPASQEAEKPAADPEEPAGPESSTPDDPR